MNKFKKYITKTYKMLPDIGFSNHWNMGYICALSEYKVINENQKSILLKHNEAMYFANMMVNIVRRDVLLDKEANESKQP